jgi:hypothetical protein
MAVTRRGEIDSGVSRPLHVANGDTGGTVAARFVASVHRNLS